MPEIGYTETQNDEYPHATAVALSPGGVQFKVELRDNFSSGAQLHAFQGGDDMSDFNGAKPVMTERDDEFKVKIVDRASGDSATKVLSIVHEGDAVSGGTNDSGVFAMVKDSDGNADILQKNADGEIPVAVRDLTHVSDSVKVGDGTDLMAVSADGEASVEITKAQGAPGAAAPAEAVQIAGTDGTNLRVISTDATGRVRAVIEEVGSAVLDYKTTATVASGAVSTHDYVITDTLTFKGASVLVGARGAVKVRVGTYDGTTFTPKMAYFQDPKENRQMDISKLTALGDGTLAIRVEITNKDGQTSDTYSTLQGSEV